jgi:hypothetical protein
MSGESVTRPQDGMNTRLNRTEKTLLATTTHTVAQVVGGQPSVNAGERNTAFTMFGGRTLASTWTVKRVDIGGNFVYVEQPRLGTNDLSLRVKLAPGGSATLRKIVLEGPPGADWHDAFSAPERREYVTNGVVAWNYARRYGFTFTPLVEGSKPTGYIRGSPDGVATMLVVDMKAFDRQSCVQPPSSTLCIIGQVVGGNMSVTPPINDAEQTVQFEMFGSKRLSAGWRVRSVDVSNAYWIRRPAQGMAWDDLSFVVSLTSRATESAIAIIRSITLEGPSNAASVEDAFKKPLEAH